MDSWGSQWPATSSIPAVSSNTIIETKTCRQRPHIPTRMAWKVPIMRASASFATLFWKKIQVATITRPISSTTQMSIHFYFSNLRAWRSHFGPLWNRLATIRQEVSLICQPLMAVCFCGAKVMTWSLVFDASFCFQRGDKDFATCTVTFAGYSNILAALFFLVACFHKTRRPEPTIVWMESPKIDVVEVPMGIVSDSDLLEVSDEKTFPFPIYK